MVTVVLSNGRKLEYENLPLANIGKSEIGRQIWVPLELLHTIHAQVLRKAGHLHFTKELEKRRDVLLRKDELIKEQLIELGNTCIQRCSRVCYPTSFRAYR